MPVINARFKFTVIEACCKALSDAGFQTFRKHNVDWPINHEFRAWVGLNTGLYADRVEISPFTGVHSVEIERLWTKIARSPYDRRFATYAIFLGELAPNERRFIFRTDVDLELESIRLALSYSNLGMAYSNSIASLAALEPLLKSRVSMLGGYPERYACCLHLQSRYEEALYFLRGFTADHPHFNRDFTANFPVPAV